MWERDTINFGDKELDYNEVRALEKILEFKKYGDLSDIVSVLGGGI